MIASIRKNMNEKDQGFTLIELLVVMIIIGILAAIAIPLFLSQREKAEDSAAKADVSTLGKEIATWYVDGTGAPVVTATGGEYFLADSTTATAEAVGNVSNNVELGTTDIVDATDWCVSVTNDQGDVAVTGYQYSAEGGLEEGDCS